MPFSNFFRTRNGQIVALFLGIGGLTLIGWSFYSLFGPSTIARSSQTRTAVCSETGKSFEVKLKEGMQFPVASPYSGKNTGHLPDETCNWTADGRPAEQTTFILMNPRLGKTGPTFCPSCDRLVVRDNPLARAGVAPPPTKAEYARNKPAVNDNSAHITNE